MTPDLDIVLNLIENYLENLITDFDNNIILPDSYNYQLINKIMELLEDIIEPNNYDVTINSTDYIKNLVMKLNEGYYYQTQINEPVEKEIFRLIDLVYDKRLEY